MSEPNAIRHRANWKRVIAAVVLAVVIGATAVAAAALTSSAKISAMGFHDDMRKLWEDHVTWTRLAIVDLVADAPDAGPTVDRLLRNQADIGDAIRPFYGDEAGDGLTALLTTHIVLAANILVNAKAGDTAGVNANVTAWYANADEIAAFLSAANPRHWHLHMMESMMRSHLDLTLKEAVAQLTGDYATSISTYEDIHLEILEMADMLSNGIIAQFPGMFNGPFPA